jgi:hypothetical protein
MKLRLLAILFRISSCLVLVACGVTPPRSTPGDVPAELRIYAWPRPASEMAQSPATPASLARLDVAKSHVAHRYALGISDGPSEVLVDGALVRQTDGGPFPPNLTSLPYEQRAQPYIELVPGRHEIAFRVRRHSGNDELGTLELDARADGHYALVTLELNKNAVPSVRQGTLGEAALAAITAPTPLALIGWPVVLLGEGIWELVNAGSGPTTPVCPGNCSTWIEDVETRAVVAGHMQ